MRQALAQASLAQAAGEVPIGAVVVYNETIIAMAHNQPIRRCDPTAHAEILALRQAAQAIGNYRLTDCDLYVTLEPCAMCAGAMVHARIRRCIFGAHDPKSAAQTVLAGQLSQQLNHRVECIGGVLAQECAEQLREFFRHKRQIK